MSQLLAFSTFVLAAQFGPYGVAVWAACAAFLVFRRASSPRTRGGKQAKGTETSDA